MRIIPASLNIGCPAAAALPNLDTDPFTEIYSDPKVLFALSIRLLSLAWAYKSLVTCRIDCKVFARSFSLWSF